MGEARFLVRIPLYRPPGQTTVGGWGDLVSPQYGSPSVPVPSESMTPLMIPTPATSLLVNIVPGCHFNTCPPSSQLPSSQQDANFGSHPV